MLGQDNPVMSLDDLIQLARSHRFSVHMTDVAIYLNRSFLGGRVSRKFQRISRFDGEGNLIPDPEDQKLLIKIVANWLDTHGPNLQKIQEEYLAKLKQKKMDS